MLQPYSKTAMLRRMEKLLDKVRSSANARSQPSSRLDRRDFLRLGTLSGAAASFGGLTALTSNAAAAVDQAQASAATSAPTQLNEVTILQLQADMTAGRLTSVELLNYYLTRINGLDQHGPGVNSIGCGYFTTMLH